MRWLFLLHQAPSSASRERVKTWRSLKRLGTLHYRNSVYVLPHSAERLEDFQWMCQQINDAGGNASVFVAEAENKEENQTLVRLFQEQVKEDYDEIRATVITLQARVNLASDDDHKIRAAFVKEANALSKRFQELEKIDFFAAPEGDSLRAALTALHASFTADRKALSTLPRRSPKEYQRRTWATREHIHIDRAASAWLIKRFIDRKATFVFAPVSGLPADVIPFDTVGAEFGHHSDFCTFETLLEVFFLRDAGLNRLAEIIHDIDLKDGKFKAAEAVGVDAAIRALSATLANDHATLAAASPIFDAFYQYFCSAEA